VTISFSFFSHCLFFVDAGAKFSQRAALECQVIITVLTAAAHTRTLERRKALDTENRMLSQVRRFLLGSWYDILFQRWFIK